MKTVTRVFVLSLSVALLLPGCGKKKADLAQPGNGNAAGTEEQLPTPSAANPAEGDDASALALVAPGAPGTVANADFEAWFRKHGLNLNDAGMLEADADEDGFSNREEFLADTDPNSGDSRPGVHKTIRLKEFTEVRLPFVVRSVEGSTATVEFTGDGAGSGTHEKVKAGDTIRGTKLRVDRVAAGTDIDKHGEKIDMSQIVLTDPDSDDRLIAVKDLPTRTNASFATLTDAEGKHAAKVKEGETFSWPDDPASKYTVIDIRNDAVVVKDENTGKTMTIVRP